MTPRQDRLKTRVSCVCIVGWLVAAPLMLGAQRGGGQPEAVVSPRAAAPIDLIGYWVAIVSEDWRWRMGVGLKGDYGYLTLNSEGRKAADSWDPAKDEATGEQCRSYGAVGVMRQPTRLHITWQDDETMRVDTDAGTQTRVLNFRGTAPQGQDPTWQGYSIARWDIEGPRPQRGQPQVPPRAGQLRVVTTQCVPGTSISTVSLTRDAPC